MERRNEIYIGDNLVVLDNLVKEGYGEGYKMIYIDPPYNTQTEKAYNDDMDSNDWMLFMEKRLVIGKELLKRDGCIFISIDDNEFANLKIVCDRVFGRSNFVGTFITKQSQRSNAKHINTIHEYILCYAKDKKKLGGFKVKRVNIPEQNEMIQKIYKEARKDNIKEVIEKYCGLYNITWLRNYANMDEDGKIYFPKDLSMPSEPRVVDIPEIGLHLDALKTRGWASDKKFIQLHNENRLVYRDGRPYCKQYLEEAEDNAPSILDFYSRQGSEDLKRLGIDGIFDTPKSTKLLKFLMRLCVSDNDNVMDFFAGSGSLAQAVYELMDEDKINLTYTLIQKSEEVDKKSDVYKVCLKYGVKPNIKDILQFRIDKYLEINNLDKDYVIIN